MAWKDPYIDDDMNEPEDNGVSEAEAASLFRKAGFKRRQDGRLTWKGLPYPEVRIEFMPDGWGREQDDTWLTITYLAEPHEGARGFKAKVETAVTVSSVEEAKSLAEDWAKDAQADALTMTLIRPGSTVMVKGSPRRVTGIMRLADGTPDAAPLILEGLKKRFAYCQVDLP